MTFPVEAYTFGTEQFGWTVIFILLIITLITMGILLIIDTCAPSYHRWRRESRRQAYYNRRNRRFANRRK